MGPPLQNALSRERGQHFAGPSASVQSGGGAEELGRDQDPGLSQVHSRGGGGRWGGRLEKDETPGSCSWM